MAQDKFVVFWFRRDLRLEDNVGLYHALNAGHKVLLLFLFDKAILRQFPKKLDRRVDYIHQTVERLNKTLKKDDTSIKVLYGHVKDCFTDLLNEYQITAVYCNEDYEQASIQRDKEVKDFLQRKNIAFHSFKDHVIFNGKEIVKKDGLPYQIYTPYAKVWRNQLREVNLREFDVPYDFSMCISLQAELPSLEDLGFLPSNKQYDRIDLSDLVLTTYTIDRDYPAKQLTSQIGIDLRFGTISIRQAVRYALKQNDTWLAQLIWRDFFMQILYHFPHVEKSSFRPQYDNIIWRNKEDEFEKWCLGQTGYPLVDAGMRELNATGYMHNRVRMVVASFLCKHLLIDWRWGEAYFAQYLNDYDLAANNGNWQWAAGSGCDAAPYFRVFNPIAQQEKFDAQLVYIKKWVPEYQTGAYCEPIVEHKEARERAIFVYKQGLNDQM
ncbi:MAG: DNA photolyase family protein [Flavobacteriaceae bacterium]|jgi:deoxyribodipyrimidine photo-lyase|nr:DNA photolyase family protein [Flavobacteriaceae bacterium]